MSLIRSLLLLYLFFFAVELHATDLPSSVTAALLRANIPLNHIGVVVWPINANVPSLTFNADIAFNPASTLKLVTSAAALSILSPAYTWSTEVLHDGVLTSDTLNGNLYIRGHGDPGLTDERLYLLVQQLQLAGIKEVTGSLIIDQSQFFTTAEPPFDEHPGRAYNAMPAATLYDYAATTIHLFATPQHLELKAQPLPPNTQLVQHIILDHAPCDSDWRDRLHTAWQNHILTITGNYSELCQNKNFAITNDQDSALLAGAFLQDWTAQGGGGIRHWYSGITPTYAQKILDFPSLTLTSVLYNMNKYSNNVMARNVFLSLATDSPATTTSADAAVHQWLHSQGLNLPELVLDNGSGLSRNARISAYGMANLLHHVALSPTYPELASSLPIWGEDGTLKKRTHNCTVNERAHLKTGTLDGVKTIAGYVHRSDGHTLVVVFFINDTNAALGAPAQEALMDWIANKL